MKARGVKQSSLAGAVGISQAAINNYLNKDRIPGADELCRLADFFSVTTDELLGRREDLAPDALHEAPDRSETDIWRDRAKRAEKELADLKAVLRAALEQGTSSKIQAAADAVTMDAIQKIQARRKAPPE